MLGNHYLVVIVLCALWMPLTVLSANRGHPPQITQHPNAEVAYKEMEPVQLRCEAHGSPKPQFYWEKDGVRLELNDNVALQNGSGVLIIAKPTPSSHDGIYQCFAYNKFGVAVTTKTVLKKAELKSFPSVYDPKIHRPEVGSSLTLKCDPPKSYPSGMVYWGENSSGAKLQPIDNTDRVSLDYSGSLHFSNIVADDELHNPTAQYLCAVYNPVLRSLVQGDDQRIEPQPGSPSNRAPVLMWSSSPKEIAIKGQTKKMKCIFSGYPTPEVTWTRLDAPLPDRAENSSFGQEIIIKQVSEEDAGQYRCSAKNLDSGPVFKQDFDLIVESLPYWRQDRLPQDVTTAEDEDVQFQCIADGVPSPTVSWSFNGRPDNELTPNSRLIVSSNRVKFLSVTKNDSQVLQCNASNVHGYILANAFLHVRAEAPSVLKAFPAKTKVAEDRRMTLSCRMDGAPKPMIQWTRGESKTPVTGKQFRIHANGDLEILGASVNDTDTYYCTGKNKLGSETIDGQLIVREKTLITEPPRSQVVNLSSRVKFVCKATTDPHERSSLTITWYKDGKLLDLSSHINTSFILVNDSLIVDMAQVADSGEYKCRADNKVDSDEVSVQLIVRDRPWPPTNVRINSCITRAEVSWSASVDNNDRILEYVVFYNRSYDPPDLYHEGARTNRTMAQIHPLLPWTSYTFHVTARNSIGTSDRSVFTQAMCSIPQAKPYRNPSHVCTRNGNPEELVITWKPMQRSEHNGEHFHYKVMYRLSPEEELEDGSEEGKWTTRTVDDWREGEIVIPKQGTYRRFQISVLAANNEGTAPDKSVGNIFGHSTEGVPSVIPTNLRIQEDTLNSTSVRFMWDPVNTSADSVNGFFKGFQVQFWKRENPDIIRTEDLILNHPPADCVLRKKSSRHARLRRSPDPVKLLTHRLWGGATINAAVVVLNGANAGKLSDVIEFTTPEGVPEGVNSLSVSERGTHHLKLEWKPPSEINGILNHFIIGYRAVNSSSHSTFMTIENPQQTTAKLHNLQPETAYTIFVEAHTLTGGGPKTHTQASTLRLLEPLDVPYIDEVEPGEDFVVVTWQPSREKPAKNPGSKFVVEYHTKDMTEQNTSSVEMHYNWINLTGLTPGKTYEIVIVAMNQAGEKARSEPKTFVLGPEQEPILHTSAVGGWFIALIVAILLLLLILFLVCFIKHRRQGKYPVYEKEKLHGCNPDNNEEEPKFGEYTKSSALPVRPTSQGSMDSIEKPLESDTNSLAEYEDTDPTKFNEDGSFIGQYGGQKKTVPTDHNAPFATIV